MNATEQSILITGGTGFIGKALCAHLSQKHKLLVWTRNPKRPADSNQQIRYINRLDEIDQTTPIDIIINLAGEPLNSRRWNQTVKQQVIESRVNTTLALGKFLKNQSRQLSLLISGSAIGWYGHQQDQPLTEASSFIDGFAHQLCQSWEDAALSLESYYNRICLLRIGIVLEKDGGPLAEMLPAFRLCAGGTMGTGNQIWSWIHRKDLIRLIEFIIETESLTGAVNACAPNPLPQKIFAQLLGKALKRPAFFPMPEFAARLMFGEFADEILLNGQHVSPNKALAQDFHFQFPELQPALADILTPIS